MPFFSSVLMFAINSACFSVDLALIFLTKENWVLGFFFFPLLYAYNLTVKDMVNIVFLRYRIYYNLLYGDGSIKSNLVMDPG